MSNDQTPLRDQLERLGRFSAENRRLVFTVVAVLLVAAMGIAATSVNHDNPIPRLFLHAYLS